MEAIVGQLMEKQRLARQAALVIINTMGWESLSLSRAESNVPLHSHNSAQVKQLECGCPDSTCADGKSCSHPMRRLSVTKSNHPDPSPSISKQLNNNPCFNVCNLYHGGAHTTPSSSSSSQPLTDKRAENNNNQVSSTTPNVLIGPRVSGS